MPSLLAMRSRYCEARADGDVGLAVPPAEHPAYVFRRGRFAGRPHGRGQAKGLSAITNLGGPRRRGRLEPV